MNVGHVLVANGQVTSSMIDKLLDKKKICTCKSVILLQVHIF